MSAVPLAAPQRRLQLLLDKRAVHAIGLKLLDVISRLQLHSEGDIPNPVEFGIALYLYANKCDDQREAEALANSYVLPSHPSPPSVRLLSRLLAVCIATYSLADQYTSETLLSAQALPPPVHKRVQAEKFLPGYAVIRDDPHGALLLCIRGSREAGDLLTNLSSDAEPFLAGFAHQGIVKSARKLHSHLRPLLSLHLSDSIFNKNGLLIFGHSLGGAVASALTLLLRYKRPPKQEPLHVTSLLANARCYSFSPPPFLDKTLMNIVRKKKLPITSIVYGLDVVPRLSAATVDKLLQTLSAYDFSPHVTGAVSRLVRSVTQPVIGRGGADKLARRAANVNFDARTLASVSGVLASVAGSVLRERSLSRSISHDEHLMLQEHGRRHSRHPSSRNESPRRKGRNAQRLNGRGERGKDAPDSRERRRGRHKERDWPMGDVDRVRGRSRDSTSSRDRERSKDSDRSKSSDKNRSKDSSKRKSRSKEVELITNGEKSRDKDSDKSEQQQEADGGKHRKDNKANHSDRSSPASSERRKSERKHSSKDKDKAKDKDADKDKDKDRDKDKDKDKEFERERDRERIKDSSKLARRNSFREGKVTRMNSMRDSSKLTRQISLREDVSDSSRSSGRHSRKNRDVDPIGIPPRNGVVLQDFRRASESDLDRRKRKDRATGSLLENSRSASKRRVSNGQRSSKSGSKESEGKDKDKESSENNNSSSGKAAWGNNVVNAMLMATRTIGNNIESNAYRYSRRKSTNNLSSNLSNGSQSMRTSASAYSLPLVASSLAMEDYNSNSNSMDLPTTDLPEMFLAGEVWHLDRAFVRPPANIHQNPWPVPRFVKRKADYFDTIEVSQWMVKDHDTSIIHRELERML